MPSYKLTIIIIIIIIIIIKWLINIIRSYYLIFS